jgi:hypothetical protein
MTDLSIAIPVPLAERDTDRNGISDYDELYLLGTNPYLSDTDRDGIPDLLDPDPLNPSLITEVVQQLGTGQGQHYAIVQDGALLQVTALDCRSGLDGQGLIFYQYGTQTLSDLRQDDLNRFAQVHDQLRQTFSSQNVVQIDRD